MYYIQENGNITYGRFGKVISKSSTKDFNNNSYGINGIVIDRNLRYESRITGLPINKVSK
jgi:hypothetical protein|tara:strand:- start:156 stop:335 length:180 start_codon:yes stop_codon:yes gene_type:complete